MQSFTAGRTFMSERPNPPVSIKSSVQGRSVDIYATASSSSDTPVNPYGPKAYGPGLNNPYALPPNQFLMQRALSFANAQPGLLVRVEVNGEITLTDRFGKEVDALYDKFGNDLTEIYDF
ncbi:UNVERIFIED_CONTAM: hypothetical protein GTU68_007053 [Idotea baltica]|nr:hypothetical protein [Idotea baltica]